MKKIVIVNQSANYLMIDTAKAFKDSGIYDKVILLVGNPESINKASEYGIEIDMLKRYNRGSIVKRFVSWLVASVQIVYKARGKYKDYDFFLVSNPPTNQIFAYFCRNKFSTLIYDVYPDGLISGGFVTRSNIVFKIWSRIAKKFYKEAERVFTISEGMAKTISQYCEMSKIEIVPLWGDESIKPIRKEENLFLSEYGLGGKFIILYSGNIGHGSNIESLMTLAESLKDNKDILFLFIGEGMLKDSMLEQAKKAKLDNVRFMPYQPFEKLSHSLSAGSLNVVSVSDKAANNCIPSKTFNLLNVEIPILAISKKESVLANLIETNGLGGVYAHNQIEEMGNFILKMKEDKMSYNEMKQNIRKTKENYSKKLAKKFYEDKGI